MKGKRPIGKRKYMNSKNTTTEQQISKKNKTAKKERKKESMETPFKAD